MECQPWPCSELRCCPCADSKRRGLRVQPGSPGKTDSSQINRFPPAGCLRWMRRDLHSRQQQQCMQLAKDSKNQIPRSAGCLDVSGSTSQAGAGEKFLQKVWLPLQACFQLCPWGPSWWGSTEWAGGSHHWHFTLGSGSVSRWRCKRPCKAVGSSSPLWTQQSILVFTQQGSGPRNGCSC